MPMVASIAGSQARHRVRDVKLGLAISLIAIVGAATAYVCVVAAIIIALRQPLGLAGAFLLTGAIALILALIVGFSVTLYRKSLARKSRRRDEAIKGLASTGLALAPLLARRYISANPKLALAAAAAIGLALASSK